MTPSIVFIDEYGSIFNIKQISQSIREVCFSKQALYKYISFRAEKSKKALSKP